MATPRSGRGGVYAAAVTVVIVAAVVELRWDRLGSWGWPRADDTVRGSEGQMSSA